MFPVDGFKWNAASAIIARSQSKNSLATEHATKAIEIGKVKKSSFQYHQNVGLVGKEHQQVLKKLVTIAN